ncbi:MAG TPA: acetate--CoA ligase family protein [Micropepsaceae bacterium]|nr:acetate--CoA ligase family protein [Micropepsaceae bacterium]
MNGAREKVAALLNPRNIVILGASDRPGNWAQRVWRNLARYEYPGAIYPYNPSRDSVWDTRCYRSFAELPEPPDHLVVLIPAHAVPATLAEAARFGARSATVMTSGFDEAENGGASEAAAQLRRVLAETGLAISGPNCLGNLNARARLMTMPDDRPQRLAAGPVAVIGQSGGIAMALKRSLEERGVDCGWAITSGNETGLTTADYIEYFAHQPGVKVIASYLESVHDAPRFLAACNQAKAAGIPVVVVKLGASGAGRAAALAHTGRLAGAMEAFDAVTKPAGVIRAGNLDAAVEIIEFLAHAAPPRIPSIGAVTFSGGLRGMLLDAAEAHGVIFAPLARATRQQLGALMTTGTVVGNPLDAGFAALTSQDAYLRAINIMLADPGVGLLLLQEELPRAAGTERKESNLRAVNEIAGKAGKPIAFFSMISHGLTDYSRTLRAELANLAFLQETAKAIRTVSSLTALPQAGTPASSPAARARMLSSPVCGGGGAPPKRRDEGGKIHSLLSDKPGPCNEVDSKTLLRRYGIRNPDECLVVTESEAIRAARRIGFPVVLKVVAEDMPHKSDAGCVVLGIENGTQLRAAYRNVMRAAKAHGISPEGMLVAKQVTDGIELALGLHRDPEMGMVIMCGAGGTALELERDVAFGALPLDETAAEAMIAGLRVAKLIAGYRGNPALDRKALVRALLSLSRLAMDAGDRIESVDVNPFLLRRRGGIALDALVVMR